MKDIKRSLITSGLSIAICVILLAGSTFAWFNDSVSNKGNTITAGVLSMQAFAYDMADENEASPIEVKVGDNTFKFKSVGKDMESAKPAIAQENIEVNKQYAQLLEVKNNGTLDFKYKLSFMTDDRGLGDALVFDIIELDSNGNVPDANEILFEPFSNLATTEIINENIKAGTSKKYLFIYKTKEYDNPDCFKDSFAGYEFIFDICMNAAQINGEFEDMSTEEPLTGDIADQNGFDEAVEMIKQGRSAEITVKEDVKLDDILNIKQGQKVVLNISEGKTVSIDNQIKSEYGFNDTKNNDAYTKRAAITVEDGAVLEIKSDKEKSPGIIKTDDYKAIDVKTGGTALIDGIKINAENAYKSGIYAIYSKGELVVKNTEIKAVTDNELISSSGSPQGGSSCYGIYAAGGTLTVDGCNINVTGATNKNTGNGASGIYINGANAELINNTTIFATGEGTSQNGIYLFQGSIGTISGVNADIKGTAIDIGSKIGEIRDSVFKGTAYSIYNRTGVTVDISNGVTVEGKTSGPLKQ